MDPFEKEMAKKQLGAFKSINANIAFLGKELKRTNDILEKHGAEATEEEPEHDPVVRVSDIEAWNRNFYDNLSVDHNLNDQETSMVFGWINRMLKDLAKQDKIVNIDIQKGE
jgi:hypothetical protein